MPGVRPDVRKALPDPCGWWGERPYGWWGEHLEAEVMLNINGGLVSELFEDADDDPSLTVISRRRKNNLIRV